MTTKADTLPSRTFECCGCEVTYFAGAQAGAGPFYCEFCMLELTLRPDGAEPYVGEPSLVENRVEPIEQLSFAVLEKGD